jgi:hypothetical protein
MPALALPAHPLPPSNWHGQCKAFRMQPDAVRTDMGPKSKSKMLPLLLIMLGCWAFSVLQPLVPSSSWLLSVEVAQVRVTFVREAAPVRNRTPLVEIGQLLAMLGLSR